MKNIILRSIFWLHSFAIVAQPVSYFKTENMPIPNDVLRFSDKVWMATNQGISYFELDGASYQVEVSNLIANCLASHKDTLWVGANNALGFFDGVQWTLSSSGLPLPFVNITQIAFDDEGVMWLVISGALFTYENGQFINQNQQANLLRIKDNDIYITTTAASEIGKVRRGGVWGNLPQISVTQNNNLIDLQITDDGVVWFSSGSSNHVWYIQSDSVIADPTSSSGLGQIGVHQNYIVRARRNEIRLMDTAFQFIRLPSTLSFGINGISTMFYKQGQFFCLFNSNNKISLLEWFPEVAIDTASTSQEIRFNDFHLGLGSLGWIGDGMETFYKQADTTYIQPILNLLPWISAIQDSTIKSSNEPSYRTSNIVYATGPVSSRYDSAYVAKYSRVWKVTQSEIETHQRRYRRNLYRAPSGIADWPGNGNVLNGEAPILAPFFDRNGNGIYEPELGDYPEILGDEMIYAIINDHRSQRNEANNYTLGAEIHVMLYTFDETNHPDLANSVFCRYAIFNRSSSDWDSTAITARGEMGAGENNYLFGSDSVEQYFFHQSDPSLTSDVFTMVGGFLNHSMSGFVYDILPPWNWLPYTPVPVRASFNAAHNFAAFSGQFGMSSFPIPPDVYKGTGFFPPFAQPDTTILTSWAFDRSKNWKFPLVENFQEDAMLGYANVYLGKVPAGESVCVDMVFNFSTSITPDLSFDVVDDLVGDLQNARVFYQNQDFSCLHQVLSVDDFEADLGEFKLFPNPIQRGNTVILKDYIDRDFEVVIFTSSGQNINPKTTRLGQETHIEISSYVPPGIYVMRLRDISGGGVLFRKIVVVD